MTVGKTVALADVATIHGGGRLRLTGKDFVTEGFPAYGAGGMNGLLPVAEYHRPGLLLSTVGTCGRCYFASGHWTSLANTQVILPDPSKVDARYLWFQLNDEARWPKSGTSQPFIKPSDVKAHRVWLPPLEEQRRIAAILDQADALRTKRREVIANLDTLTRAIFSDIFGDPLANPRGWPQRELRTLGRVVTGKTPPATEAGMFGGPVPFITPGDLGSGATAKRTLTDTGAARSRVVRPGATLVCCIGATIGKVGVARRLSAFNQQINAIEWSDELDDSYGYSSMEFRRSVIAAAGSSTTLPLLNKSDFGRLAIPVPTLNLQREYATRVHLVERVVASQSAQIERLDEMLSCLTDRAFKGEL